MYIQLAYSSLHQGITQHRNNNVFMVSDVLHQDNNIINIRFCECVLAKCTTTAAVHVHVYTHIDDAAVAVPVPLRDAVQPGGAAVRMRTPVTAITEEQQRLIVTSVTHPTELQATGDETPLNVPVHYMNAHVRTCTCPQTLGQ